MSRRIFGVSQIIFAFYLSNKNSSIHSSPGQSNDLKKSIDQRITSTTAMSCPDCSSASYFSKGKDNANLSFSSLLLLYY